MTASTFPLRASSAHRWVHCYGSVAVCAPFSEDDSPDAQEGIAGHWAATEPLEGRVVNLGDRAPNGVAITQEMIDGAALYHAAVLPRIAAGWLHVEDTLPMPDIHPQNGGTVDTWGMGYDAWVLHVVDYKFGHGFVEVFENWQLIDYVSGIVSELLRRGALPENYEELLTVELTIVQPRSYHRDGPVRSWRTRLVDLRAQFNLLRDSAALAMRPGAATRTGEWCEHCPGRHVCRTLQNASLQIADRAGDSTPFALDATQTGNELRWLRHARDLLDARITGLSAEALTRIRKGESVAHFRAEHSVGNEKWIPGKEEEVILMGDILGKDVRKPVSAITPTQARAKGIDADVISQYSHRPTGELKLVPMDATQTRKIFGGNTA